VQKLCVVQLAKTFIRVKTHRPHAATLAIVKSSIGANLRCNLISRYCIREKLEEESFGFSELFKKMNVLDRMIECVE